MTNPISFDAIRYPALGDPCDGVAAFSNISTDVDTNLDRINAHVSSRPTRFETVVSTQQPNSYQYCYGATSGWTDIDGVNFPTAANRVTWTIPTDAKGLLLQVSAQLSAGIGGGGGDPWVMHCWYLSGPGIRNQANKDHIALAAMRPYVGVVGTRLYLYQEADIIPGQTVTLVPAVQFGFAGGSGDVTRIAWSGLTVIAFTSEAA